MAARRTDDELDRLLAQGRLGGPARDAVFDEVLARMRPRRFFGGWRLAIGGFAFAALAAGVLVVAPRFADQRQRYGVKGGAPAGGLTVDLVCDGGSLEACPIGSILVFGAAAAQSGHLAAWAERRDGSARVWYFSSEGSSPPIRAAAPLGPVWQGIRVGSEHPPGEYVVHMVLTKVPMTRAALVRGREGVIARAQIPLRIQPRE